MRKPRFRNRGDNWFHAISRVVDRRPLLNDVEKAFFVNRMWALANGLNIEIGAYCIMSNHIHILLKEPDLEDRPKLTRAELFKRLPHLYSPSRVDAIAAEFDAAARRNDTARTRAILQRHEKRMGNVSVFMKELKQGFSRWYNKRHNRRGTLWEDRFKSPLVEGKPTSLLAVAAYIDLNPVRAGMVSKVEDYRWCGYGAAVGGDNRARQSLALITGHVDHLCGDDRKKTWREMAAGYRLWLYRAGEEKPPVEGRNDRGRLGFSAEQVAAEERRQGQMSLPEALRHRVGYFTEGAVLGSASFVEEVFERHREWFGQTRRSGARPMRGADWRGLCTLRDFRRGAPGASTR